MSFFKRRSLKKFDSDSDDIEVSTELKQEIKLVIGIVSAKDLLAADSNGLSDPFVVIIDENGRHETKKHVKTKIIHKTLNPTWNETFTLHYSHINPEQLVYKLELYDYDMLRKNDPLGHVNVRIKDLLEGHQLYIGEDNKFELPVIDGTGTLTFTINPENFGDIRKPPVFGVALRSLLARDDIKESILPIPAVVLHCCRALFKNAVRYGKGIMEEGIFRLSGNNDRVKAMQALYDKDLISEFNEKNGVDNPCDILPPHDCSGILKLFLRELDEPLLGFDAYKPIFKAIKIGKSDDEIISMIKRTISSRLTPHETILVNVILFLLYQTTLYSNLNKMGPTNMAVVFGQIFLCEPISAKESDTDSNLNAALKEVEMRNRACELMIVNYFKLFTGKERSLQRVYYPYLQEEYVDLIYEDNGDEIEAMNRKLTVFDNL
jgi:hypothetical protein